ncbi:MAG TPA: tetratricopeptide repeat protein [Gemmatimonadaceae bacterium]|nr:tetratricopeptide repeat protein [Gemmatimonadaceae bacterium]
MFRLHVLGGARIEGPSGRLSGEAVQRHRLALLALLSAARDGRLPRERLISVLWPEAIERDGRHLLNVSVHVIRKALGERVLRTEGADLRLDHTALGCDLCEFRNALAQGDVGAAVASYSGPFLDGFFLGGSPEFDQWQDAERARVEDEFTSAVETLAAEAMSNREWPDAVRWWQMLWTPAPERERTTLGLMQALEASGDRAGALRAAEAHITYLADEFGAEAGQEVTRLAARIRNTPASPAGHGDTHPPESTALDAHASERSSVPATVGASARPARASASTGPPIRRWSLRASVGAALLVVVGALAFALNPWQTPERLSVAVLPFVDLSPSGDRAYLGDGMTEELLNALARIPGLHVAARSSSFQFRDPGVDVRVVGDRLGVDAVVEGSVRLDGNQLRVTAQLIESERGYHLWSGRFDRRVEDLFAVQEEIARTVATALGAKLGRTAPDTLVRRRTGSPRAYDLYLRGRHAWNRRTTADMWRALGAFEEAVQVDPAYAAAYAGLADTWQLLPDYGNVNARQGLARAKTAALRAIALDSTLAEAHASLGAVLDDYDRDRAGAEQAYRTAILLNPAYATARQWLSIHLADEGRHEEAAAEMERARRLDPLSRIINTAVGAIRYFARDYDSAIAEYRAVVQQAPDFALGWALMGRVYLVQGRLDSAVATLERSVTLSGGDPSYQAVYAAALAASGRLAEARQLAESVRDAQPEGYVPYCELASAFIYLGDFPAALSLFERGFEERDPAVKHMAVEPLYDRIRAEARFQDLLQRAGLTGTAAVSRGGSIATSLGPGT